MALLQALFALITKSAGKILTSIFGWAVRALFGRTSPREAVVLSGLVGAAAAWPLLLVGLAAPKTAAMVLAFVPIPQWVPSWTVRLVWLGLALSVPFVVGLTVASRAPADRVRGPFVKRLLSGVPITIGLALAFLIMFISVPFMRLATLLLGKSSADIPLITESKTYHQVAALVVDVLNRNGFEMKAGKPGWWVSAPIRVLEFFGGDSFGAFVPHRLEYFRSSQLTVSFYPSGILLQGKGPKLTWAHGLVCEVTSRSPGLQTTSPAAQELEKQIKRLWNLYDDAPEAHVHSKRLQGRIAEITRDLGSIDIEFDDWQVIYRQLMQVDRALSGHKQLLEERSMEQTKVVHKAERVVSGEIDTTNRGRSNEREQAIMQDKQSDKQHEAGGSGIVAPPAAATEVPARELSTTALIKEIGADVTRLARSQIDLALTELRADLKNEAGTVVGLGFAAFSGFATVIMLLVTATLALAQWIPAWQAGLIVSGVILVVALVAALVSWSKRVRSPLVRTRRTIEEDVQWAKERLA